MRPTTTLPVIDPAARPRFPWFRLALIGFVASVACALIEVAT